MADLQEFEPENDEERKSFWCTKLNDFITFSQISYFDLEEIIIGMKEYFELVVCKKLSDFLEMK